MKFGDKESGFAKPLKRLTQRVAEALTAVFMLLNAVMCSAPSDSEKGVSDSTQKLRQEMFKPLHEGKMDVVFHELRPYYDSVRGIDDNAQLLAALYLAEAYAMREDADSVKYFMDAATPLAATHRRFLLQDSVLQHKRCMEPEAQSRLSGQLGSILRRLQDGPRSR